MLPGYASEETDITTSINDHYHYTENDNDNDNVIMLMTMSWGYGLGLQVLIKSNRKKADNTRHLWKFTVYIKHRLTVGLQRVCGEQLYTWRTWAGPISRFTKCPSKLPVVLLNLT